MKKAVSLLGLLVLFVSCESQVGTAVGTAFSNLFSGNGFNSSSSDELYNQMKEDMKNNPETNTAFGTCTDTKSGGFVIPDKVTSNMSKIKDELCSCKAWGSCEKGACQCEVLCPKNFDILNRPLSEALDAPGNSLSFTNTDKSFYEKDSNYAGYCWGHALITQRFNRMATFKPESYKPFKNADESSQRLRNYKYIISRINNNEPVDILGFKNLQEFSSDPEVKELLEDTVKKNWAENAMSSQGLSMVVGSDVESEEYYKKLFDDVEYRLKNNQSPAIVMNENGNATRSHTVLVSGSGVLPTGERYLCIRDNNVAADKSLDCKNKMKMTKEGSVHYSLWNRTLGKIKVSYTENSNTLEQVNNLHKKCLGDKKCIAAQAESYN